MPPIESWLAGKAKSNWPGSLPRAPQASRNLPSGLKIQKRLSQQTATQIRPFASIDGEYVHGFDGVGPPRCHATFSVDSGAVEGSTAVGTSGDGDAAGVGVVPGVEDAAPGEAPPL